MLSSFQFPILELGLTGSCHYCDEMNFKNKLNGTFFNASTPYNQVSNNKFENIRLVKHGTIFSNIKRIVEECICIVAPFILLNFILLHPILLNVILENVILLNIQYLSFILLYFILLNGTDKCH
jgi:hypothetical protein